MCQLGRIHNYLNWSLWMYFVQKRAAERTEVQEEQEYKVVELSVAF